MWLERGQGEQKRILKVHLRGLDLSWKVTEGHKLQGRGVCVLAHMRV